MRIKNIILVAVGFIMLLLGTIGILLPIWPTTPFFLVAAACFSCAPNLRRRLEKIPFFGEHVENYRTKRGLQKRTVRISMMCLWSMLLVSGMMIWNIWSTLLFLVIGTGVSAHIIYMSKARGIRNEA